MRTKLNLAIILTVLMVSGALAWSSNEVGATFINAFFDEANLTVKHSPTLFGAPEYNAREEFSLTQGGTSGVWRYGSTANDASNAFVENLVIRTTPECGSPAERWNLSNTGDPSPEIIRFLHPTNCIGTPADSLYVHPGPSGQRSVLRWVAPAAGTFQLTGALQRANSSATTDIRIVKNETTSLFSGSIGAVYQQTFSVIVTVAMNEPVDFSVGWGDNDNSNSDGSALNVSVAPAPTACMAAPSDLQVNVTGENSPIDVQSVNTNAQLIGNATYTNSGKVGRAMSFDGAGDYVRIEDNAAQRPATAVTVEGWFKLNSTSGIVQLVGKPVRGTFTNSYGVYLDGGTLRGLVGNNLGQWTRANSGYSPTLGQWNHLAFTYVMNAGVSTLKLYANGVDITSSVDGTANLPLYYDANPYPLIIGADIENDAPAFSMNGQADEVSIYGRALSGAEIFDIVQQGSFGKCPPANCVQPANGVISWFAGEQNALDSKSNNHGALQSGSSFANGKVGQAFSFDGTDDFVAVPDSGNLDIVGDLSIEAWIRPTANPAFTHIVSKRSLDNSNAEYDLLRQGNGAIRFSSKNAGTDSFVISNGTAPINTWTHVAVTIQGGTLKFYLNGVEDSSYAFAFVRPATAGRLTIGAGETTACGGSGVCEFFAGQIDELSIYNRAISASEALSVFNANSSGKCKPTGSNPPTNQTAWFTGDGDARDLTGPSTGGTLSGDTTYRVGRVSQAFKLDGSGDYISTPDNAKWDFGTGDFAIESWFNTPSGTGVQRIISAGAMSDGGNNLWSLGYGDICAWGCGQRINFAVHNGSGSYSDFSSNQLQIRPNTWHHVAVVRSGTTFTFYFDGVASGTATVGAGYAINGGSTGAIIGARYNGNPNDRFEFANGMLDEISLYSRPMTANEVAAIYNAGVAGKTKADLAFPGANSTTQLSDATVTFANNISGGLASQHGIDLGMLPPLPANTTATGLAYEISTTATYQTGNPDDVRVCFNIPALSTIGAGGLRLLHLENGNWVDRTASGNSLSNFCSDNLRTLSPFVIVEGNAPSSYGISGRVTNGGGNGVANVLVTLSGDASSTATTNANGDYSFGSLNAGGSFTITPSLAGYSFDPTNRVYNPLTENISNAHFTAAAIPTVSMGDATVTEGDSGSVNANFNMTLSSSYPGDVTVFYSTSDGTATAGQDYTSVATSVVFASGETTKVVAVPVLGDTDIEGDETFNIAIVSATNATILDGNGVGTINDNDNPPCVSAPTGLQNWYRFQDNAQDVFNLRPGAAVGNPTYTTGKVGQAIVLDGVDDSVDFGSWFNYQTFSASMWINLAPYSEQPQYAAILDNNHTGSTNWVIHRSGSADQFEFGDNAGGNVIFTPTPNTWQLLTVTRESGTSMKVYLNGVLVGEDNSIGTIPYNGAQFLRLGRWGGGGRHLKGKVDELDIYDRVLSPAEIISVYSAGGGGKCIPPQCTETPANQVAAFKGENNANDSQGTNHGTGNGGVTYSAGKVGQGLTFDGVNDFVEIPDSSVLKPANITIETWVKFNSLTSTTTGGAPTGYQNLIFKKNSRTPGSGWEGGYSLVKNPDDRLGIGFNSPSGGENFANSTTVMQVGTWYHIAATHDGTNIRLYVNGQLEGSGTATFPIDHGTTPLYLGSSQVPFSGYFNGVLDESSIYNRALAANEIQSIFDAGSAGKCPELGCGTADYQFNDNLDSSIPGAIPLSFIGTGQTFTTETVNGVSERVMNHTAGNAVELRPTSSVIPSNQYEITILTKLDDTYNWGRILDFSDGGNNGVYVNVDTLYFVGAGVQASAPAVHGGVWVELKFTRTAAGIFTAYVNGVQQFSFNDTGGLSIIGPTNALRFFKDDLHEHDSGAIARIQLSPGDGCSGGGQCVTAPANNVAWYRGNNNPLDFGSNPPMHASMENGATFALGKVGNGFSFDGVNDFVSAPDDNKFDITGDLSIESWVRPAQIQPGEVTLVSKRDTANSNVNYVLYLQNGQLMFASRSNGGGFTVNASGITLSPATFSHVAVTIESGTLKFYVNGVPTAPQTTAASRSASTGRLTIGAYETTSAGDFFIGVIDELAIYSRALTAGEILSIFNADSAGKCVSGGNTTTYSIGGRVTDHNGAGLGNVPVGLSDGPTTFGSISTDANGYYLWYNLQANSNYTVTPTLANTTFTPTSRSYTNITNNVADANFAANAPCTYTLDPPTSNIFPAAGGTGTFNVQTQPGCSWTATTNSNASSWVTFNGPTTGTGNGTVNYTVAANTSYIRVGDIMVNGTQYVLGQETGSGTCATVTPITYGTVINGALAGSDCNQSGRNTDQYSFSGTAGERIMIRLSSSDFAEALIVHNSANTTIFATATGGAATDARVPNSYGFYTLPVTGTYIISATNWGNGGSPTGNYTFTLHSDRTVPGVTPPAGLIGWYAGEADTRNQQGNSPGTFNGTATYATDYVGQSFNMNGTDRYVEVPSASEPFNVSSISVEAWVNTTTTAGNRTIASKFNGSGGASWSLDMEAGGAMIFTVYDGTTANFRASRTVGSAAFLTANEWKHVAATFDHTTQAIALYVNGANAGDLVAGSSPNIGGIGQNSVPVRISAKFNGSMQGFWSGRLDEISIYNRAITHEEVESIIDAGRIGKIKTAAINNQTSVSLGTSTINFAVATTGSATETPIDAGALPAPLPMGQSLHLAFNISTNAPFTGMATVCFAVPTVTPTEFATLKVYHLEGGVWVDRTAPGNVYPTLCANTPSFSPFAIAKPLGPSSSNVTVGGRVLTDSGQGIKNTHVSLSLADGTVLRTRSSSFGYYRFDNIESGQTGILSVHSKRFVFAQPNRVITISDDLNDLDFIAEP